MEGLITLSVSRGLTLNLTAVSGSALDRPGGPELVRRMADSVGDTAEIRATKGVSYQVIVDGERIVDVASKGNDVIPLE